MVRNWSLLEAVKQKPCIVCGGRPVDPCHIKSFGSGGPDEDWNLISMCRKHHAEQHQVGFVRFLKRHLGAMEQLKSMGWEIIDSIGKPKLWHSNLGEKKE